MKKAWASALLEVERERTVTRIRALSAELEGIVAAALDANGDDEHDPEGATVAFEREQASALRATAEAHLGEVDRAMARVETGAYGTCRLCGCPIGRERLTALPVTEVCIGCAR